MNTLELIESVKLTNICDPEDIISILKVNNYTGTKGIAIAVKPGTCGCLSKYSYQIDVHDRSADCYFVGLSRFTYSWRWWMPLPRRCYKDIIIKMYENTNGNLGTWATLTKSPKSIL